MKICFFLTVLEAVKSKNPIDKCLVGPIFFLPITLHDWRAGAPSAFMIRSLPKEFYLIAVMLGVKISHINCRLGDHRPQCPELGFSISCPVTFLLLKLHPPEFLGSPCLLEAVKYTEPRVITFCGRWESF